MPPDIFWKLQTCMIEAKQSLRFNHSSSRRRIGCRSVEQSIQTEIRKNLRGLGDELLDVVLAEAAVAGVVELPQHRPGLGLPHRHHSHRPRRATRPLRCAPSKCQHGPQSRRGRCHPHHTHRLSFLLSCVRLTDATEVDCKTGQDYRAFEAHLITAGWAKPTLHGRADSSALLISLVSDRSMRRIKCCSIVLPQTNYTSEGQTPWNFKRLLT
jgi:hypothetical protein